MAFLIVLLIILIILIIYFLLIFTRRDETKDFSKLEERLIAHRGLFDNDKVPENSLVAYEKAIKSGYSIELDVHLTKDNQLVCIHDSDLSRMCGVEKTLEEISLDEMKSLFLLNTSEKIPTFKEALSLIDGRTPIFVEIKYQGNYMKTARRTARMLDSYIGTYAIQSFQPKVVRWFHKNRPSVISGQLCSNFIKSESSFVQKISPTHTIFLSYSRPDFIAQNYNQRENINFKLIQKITNLKTQVWSIRSKDDLYTDLDNYDMIIFDSFNPK